MMKSLIVIILLVLLATPVSAAKSEASCTVSPAIVSANAPLTFTATANVYFSVIIHDPNGTDWYNPKYLAGEVTTGSFSTPYAGSGLIDVVAVLNHNYKRLASCAFTVLP